MSAVTPQVANALRAKQNTEPVPDLQAIVNGLRMSDLITTLHTYLAAHGTDITRIGSRARRYYDRPSIETTRSKVSTSLLYI
jgi:hypothetical protein